MSRGKARAALLQELEEAMRRSSAQGAMFAKPLPIVAGISASDLDCMDFLNLEGRMTAGRLAEVTGPDHGRHHRRGRSAGEGRLCAARAR